MAAQYRADRVEITGRGVPRPASWTFAGSSVSGNEHTYDVIDRNFSSKNEWEFVVRVPRERSGRIEVRPYKVANRTVWAVLDSEGRPVTLAQSNE